MDRFSGPLKTVNMILVPIAVVAGLVVILQTLRNAALIIMFVCICIALIPWQWYGQLWRGNTPPEPKRQDDELWHDSEVDVPDSQSSMG